MDEPTIRFGEGNFCIPLYNDLLQEHFEIAISVKNIDKGNELFNDYYKSNFAAVANGIIKSCLKHGSLFCHQENQFIFNQKILEILCPYLRCIAETFNTTCSYFEPYHILFSYKPPINIDENQYVFYLEDGEYLHLCYKNLGNKVIDNCIPCEYSIQEIFKNFKNDVDLEYHFKDSPEILNKLKRILSVVEGQDNNIKKALTNFEKAIIKNFDDFLSRLSNDMESIICPVYLFGFEYPKLIGIDPTGSDLHNRSNQVFILEFCDEKNIEKKRKIVYKPTPIEMDFMLFGNIEKLRCLDKFSEKYNNFYSFIEIMNYSLDEDNKLPTYMIVPCKDTRGFYEVTNHYGYIEHISRGPHFKENESKKFYEEIESCQDYVLIENNPEKIKEYIKKYSIQTGLYIAFMLATGLVDCHNGNQISKIVRIKDLLMIYRYLIDGEISFSLLKRNIDNTSCCFYYINPMGAFCSPEKNYHCGQNFILLKNGDTISPLPVDKTIILEWIEKGLRIIKEKKENSNLINIWFKNLEEIETFVRITPMSTDQMNNSLAQMYKACFYKENSFKYLNSLAIDFLMQDELQIKFVLFLRQNRNFVLEEAMYFSVPTCYIKVSEQKLYLSNGSVCIIPTRQAIEQELMEIIVQNYPENKVNNMLELMRNKLDDCFLLRNSNMTSDDFLLITPCEDEENKLGFICRTLDRFMLNLDIVQLNKLDSSKTIEFSQSKNASCHIF